MDFYQRQSELSKELLRSDDLLKDLTYILLGVEERVEKGKIEIIKVAEPLLPQELVNKIVSIVRTLLNKNTYMSNFPDFRTANKLALIIANEITDYLYLSMREYNLNPEDIDIAVNIVLNYIQNALFRSVKSESDKAFLGKVVYETRTEQVQKDENKGIFGIFRK